MGINRKQALLDRKAFFERQLKDRMSFLSQKGIESPRIDKDTIVKKLRASVKAINGRMKTVAGYEEKTEALAKAKAEKAAPHQKDPEEIKEKKAKKTKEAKEAPAEGKEKKKKKVEKAEAKS